MHPLEFLDLYMQISNESKMLELEYEINAQEFGPADDHVQSYIFILVTLIFFAFLSKIM